MLYQKSFFASGKDNHGHGTSAGGHGGHHHHGAQETEPYVPEMYKKPGYDRGMGVGETEGNPILMIIVGIITALLLLWYIKHLFDNGTFIASHEHRLANFEEIEPKNNHDSHNHH